MDENEHPKCCLCGGDIEIEPYFHGCNPWPVKDDGYCCPACDTFVVLPARMQRTSTYTELNR